MPLSRPKRKFRFSSDFLFKDSPARTAILGLLIAVATIAVYLPVHDHPFTNSDDPQYVTQNAHIQDGLSAGVLFWAFTHGYALNWHPLTWASHALDINLFGLDPAGHHDENVLLHALNAFLLFWVLKRATRRTGPSFMVAALFALHPLNVEAVAWVAERKTMLSTLFFLLALGAYRWYASRPGVARYMVVAASFGLGLLCKPQIIMFPLVLLLWDYWPLQRMAICGRTSGDSGGAADPMPVKTFWWLLKEKAPLFVISLMDAAITLVAQHVVESPQANPVWVRIENAVVSYARYLGKAFWPSNLSVVYPYLGRGLRWWQVAGALLLLLTITVLAARARKGYHIVGWLWFLIMLVPTIGLVQVCGISMADRYAYDSFLGLFVMLCWGVGDWAAERRLPRLLLPAASAACLLGLSLVTYQQIGYWSDDVRLWTHCVKVTTGNWTGEYMEGLALDGEGRHAEAAQHYFLAAAGIPDDPLINSHIAAYERASGNLSVAIEYYQKVVVEAWNPDQQTQALMNLAETYRLSGDYSRAEECMATLRTVRPRAVDWQGAWWKQVFPMIRESFHRGSSEPKNK